MGYAPSVYVSRTKEHQKEGGTVRNPKLAVMLVLAFLAGSALAGLVYAASSGETEVRISARRLADGRTEFALQQRDGASWGERQLATARYFPAEIDHSRWLNSSPYTVSIEIEDELNAPEFSDSSTESGGQVALGEETSGTIGLTGISYFHGDAGVNGLRTILSILGSTDDSLYEDARLAFICDHDVSSLWVWVQAGVYIGEEWHEALLDEREGVTTAAFGTISQQVWSRQGFATYDDGAQIGDSGDALSFLVEALSNRWVSVSLATYDDSIVATFDLSRAFGTPIQHLLTGCLRN